MSSLTVVCDQDALNAITHTHFKVMSNLGYYENVGKQQGVCGKGLIFLSRVILDVLRINPQSNISKTQWKNAFLDANKLRNFNHSGLPDKTWAGQRAERMITIQSHMRRVWREPQRMQQAMKTMNQGDGKQLVFLVGKVSGDPNGVNSDSEVEEIPRMVEATPRRQLKKHWSNDSAISVDSQGLPSLLTTPKHEGQVGAEANSPIKDSFLDCLNGVEDGDERPLKRPAAAQKSTSTERPLKRPAAASTSTSTVDVNVNNQFNLKITYATKQSYIHHLAQGSAFKTFLVSKSSGDHRAHIKKVVNKIKAAKLKDSKAKTVKDFARSISNEV